MTTPKKDVEAIANILKNKLKENDNIIIYYAGHSMPLTPVSVVVFELVREVAPFLYSIV